MADAPEDDWREPYLDYRKELLAILKEQWGNYEKLVTTISAGGLGSAWRSSRIS